LQNKDKLGRSPSDLVCLHKAALADLSADIDTWPDGTATDDWMGEVYATLLRAGAAPCATPPAKHAVGDAAEGKGGKTKKEKKTKKKLSKKAQKAQWSETQWGPTLDLQEMGLGDISGSSSDYCDLDVVDGSLSSDDFLAKCLLRASYRCHQNPSTYPCFWSMDPICEKFVGPGRYILLNRPVIIRQAQMEGSPISANVSSHAICAVACGFLGRF